MYHVQFDDAIDIAQLWLQENPPRDSYELDSMSIEEFDRKDGIASAF